MNNKVNDILSAIDNIDPAKVATYCEAPVAKK